MITPGEPFRSCAGARSAARIVARVKQGEALSSQTPAGNPERA